MSEFSEGKINVLAICAQNLLQLYRVKPVLLIAQAFFLFHLDQVEKISMNKFENLSK